VNGLGLDDGYGYMWDVWMRGDPSSNFSAEREGAGSSRRHMVKAPEKSRGIQYSFPTLFW